MFKLVVLAYFVVLFFVSQIPSENMPIVGDLMAIAQRIEMVVR